MLVANVNGPTELSEWLLLPGTAFGTGFHPLKCRGRRHFLHGRSGKIFINLTR